MESNDQARECAGCAREECFGQILGSSCRDKRSACERRRGGGEKEGSREGKKNSVEKK